MGCDNLGIGANDWRATTQPLSERAPRVASLRGPPEALTRNKTMPADCRAGCMPHRQATLVGFATDLTTPRGLRPPPAPGFTHERRAGC